MDGISGKVVAITGASSGTGEATAVYLAERGARLVLGARRIEMLEQVVGRITATGAQAVAERTDVRARADVDRLVAAAQQHYGQLDVMFSNAGSMAVSGFDEMRVEDWEAMVDVNIKDVLHGIAAALPVFRSQDFGHFVHTASTAAHKVSPAQGVYAATKTAVRVLSEGLRQEAGPALRVTLISPGSTHTEGVGKGGSAETAAALILQRDKLAIPPEAIARAVAFAIEQPPDVDVGEIIVRPTAQG